MTDTKVAFQDAIFPAIFIRSRISCPGQNRMSASITRDSNRAVNKIYPLSALRLGALLLPSFLHFFLLRGRARPPDSLPMRQRSIGPLTQRLRGYCRPLTNCRMRLKFMRVTRLNQGRDAQRKKRKRLQKSRQAAWGGAPAHSGAPIPRRYATTPPFCSLTATLRGVSPEL